MKLYQNSWTIYPRRVAIYLKEKGISGIEIEELDVLAGDDKKAYLDVNPTGTLPALAVASGELVHESTAIMEYLEELHPEPNLIGRTPLERAATRDFVNALNDAYSFAVIYVVHVSRAWADRVDQKPDAAAVLRERYRQLIGKLEILTSDGPFVPGTHLTYADCAFYASAEYLDSFYGEPLPDTCVKLRRAYENFATRRSAAPPTYPAEIQQVARLRV